MVAGVLAPLVNSQPTVFWLRERPAFLTSTKHVSDDVPASATFAERTRRFYCGDVYWNITVRLLLCSSSVHS